MIEIADEKAGKGKAFAWLLEELQIPPENSAAFGNAENDIDMMKTASMGYAVSNADEECLQAADWITASNDEDGVAKAMIEFMSWKKGIER
ncbi:MAG: HAD hydrolase family protein, partial [Dorea sp.]|nr:HAD hydrolase family protein [Dorea sp.]